MIFQNFTFWIGTALCVMALLQLIQWSRQSWIIASQNKKQFELSRELLRQQIREKTETAQQRESLQVGAWSGFRPFRVAKLVKETSLCTSVYLEHEDGKPTCAFLPGQHLTFKFQIPGESKPIVRCYSLSEGPAADHYRISVKAMPAPRSQPKLPPGRASNYINQGLTEGTRLEVKAPSGHFHLDENSELPVVLLAGGIGITPMLSIVEHMTATKSERRITLLYGVKNSSDHQFKQRFLQLAQENQNLQVFNCYSHPAATEQRGRDFEVQGYASLDVLKTVLENNNCQFYMCGPPPFMESLYNGLIQWGVPESNVFFEAFGPASIGKAKKNKSSSTADTKNLARIKFANSDVNTSWSQDCESILELAEENDVMIDSGCRAGSCGTCATEILNGKVSYDDPDQVTCDPGKCH